MCDTSSSSSSLSGESLYSVLGVHILATPREIAQAYRRLCLRLHPDRTGGCAEATRHFLRVQEAYDVLADPESRHQYDLLLLHLLYCEEYLHRFTDLTLTAQGLQLGMRDGAGTQGGQTAAA